MNLLKELWGGFVVPSFRLYRFDNNTGDGNTLLLVLHDKIFYLRNKNSKLLCFGRIESCGDPGARLIMQEFNSSSEKATSSPRSFLRYQMKMFFSHHKIVNVPRNTYHIEWIVEKLDELRMVVAQRHGGDLRVDIEKNIAVHVDEIVAEGAVIICKQLHRTRLLQHNNQNIFSKFIRATMDAEVTVCEEEQINPIVGPSFSGHCSNSVQNDALLNFESSAMVVYQADVELSEDISTPQVKCLEFYHDSGELNQVDLPSLSSSATYLGNVSAEFGTTSHVNSIGMYVETEQKDTHSNSHDNNNFPKAYQDNILKVDINLTSKPEGSITYQNNNVKESVLEECDQEQTFYHHRSNVTDNVTVKSENIEPSTTTDDESMAVEALQQLGGGDLLYSNLNSLLHCYICGSKFHSRDSFQKHLSLCAETGMAAHTCSVCRETFTRKSDLENHLVCHQVDRPYACKICSTLFCRKAELQNHMTCHNVNRPLKCPQCGTDFQRLSSLTNHMKIHNYPPGKAVGLFELRSDGKPISMPSAQEGKLNVKPLQGIQPLTTLSLVTTPCFRLFNQPNLNQTGRDWDTNFQIISNTSEVLTTENKTSSLFLGTSVSHVNTTDTSLVSRPMEETSFSPASKVAVLPINSFNFSMNQSVDENSLHNICNSTNHTSGQLVNCSKIERLNTQIDKPQGGDNLVSKSDSNFCSVKVESMPYIMSQGCHPEEMFSTQSPEQDLPKAEDKRPHICRHCGTAFARIKALQSHVRLHEDNWGAPLYCKKCEENFPDEISLNRHQLRCTGPMTLPHGNVNRSLQSTQNPTLPTGPYTKSFENGVRAAETKTKLGKHCCEECEKRFATKQKLFRHMWVHRRKQYVCEVCGCAVKSQQGLDEHRHAMHPGENRHICFQCGKSFVSRQGLWEHGRVHGRGPPGVFHCQQCSKQFTSRQGFLIHNRTHTGERPYGCKFCTKAFRDGGTLRKHERIHTGERPHACPLCHRAFNQKICLYQFNYREEVVGEQELLYKEEDPEIPLPQNQDSYTLMRPYPCDFCSRRFRKKANLMNHMVSHQTDRPHGCNLCGARYRRKCDLINHMKIHAYAPGLAGASDDDDDIPSNHSRENAHPTIKGRRKKAQSSAPKKRRSISSNTQSSREIEFDELSFYKDGKPYSSTRKKNTNIYLDDGVHLPPSSVGGDSEKHAEPPVPKWPVTDETRPYVCQHCGVGFAREKALASHARIHAGDSPFECNTCGEMFWDVTLLRDHARNKHRNAVAKYNNDGSYVPDNSYRDFRCEICELSFDTQEHLKRHRKSHIKVEPPSNELMCQLCGEMFPDQAELALHADCHARYQPHRCMLCGHCFEDAASVATHVRRRHGKNVPDFTCSLCGKTCKDRRSLQKHSWVHSAERSFPCHKCSKRFHSRARLKRHMVSHRDKAVSCNECGEEFPDGRALINHRHSHNKDLTARQFSCMECGKTFGSRSSQQIHARIHTGERPHMVSHRDKAVSCNECGEEFPDGRALINHRHSHNKDLTARQFSCMECGKTFGSRSSQQIHARIHTGERPYGCRFCWKAFADGGTLRKHERIHTGEKPYACVVCPRAFNQRSADEMGETNPSVADKYSKPDLLITGNPINSERDTLECMTSIAYFFLMQFINKYIFTLIRSDELCAHLIHHSDENTARHRMPSLGPRKYKRRRRLMAHELNRFSNFAEKYATSDRRDSDSESDEDLKRKITKKKYKTKSKPSASDSLKTVAKALNSVAEKFNLIVHSKSESGKAKQERKSQKAKRKLAPNRKFAGVSGNSKSKEVAKRPIVNFNSGGFVKRTRPPTEGRVRPRTKNVTSSTLAALKAVSTISKNKQCVHDCAELLIIIIIIIIIIICGQILNEVLSFQKNLNVFGRNLKSVLLFQHFSRYLTIVNSQITLMRCNTQTRHSKYNEIKVIFILCKQHYGICFNTLPVVKKCKTLNVQNNIFVLYGRETWSLTLHDDKKVRVLKKTKNLKRIFGPKREEDDGY
uniref:Zinc finger protein 865 n=1 Tax=Timema californicum TaxID=61474 RepID=A0A7R9P3Z2_TIMCA|nr:unnamed protein product [Timema californicum]